MRRASQEILTTIWKFPIPTEDSFTIDMPAGSVPLSVGVQTIREAARERLQPALWAMVPAESPRKERHRFYLCGTSHPLGEARFCRFIGTFQIEGYGLVFHLFDGGPEEEQP